MKSFTQYANSLILDLKEAGRYGTAANYQKTTRCFVRFLQTTGRGDVRLDELNEELIAHYNNYLYARGLVRNTVSFYNRVLRVIYLKGCRALAVPDLHPFDAVYTGVDRTVNRVIDERDICRLMTVDTGGDVSLALARDLFTFSYLVRGMTFVDMAFLRHSDVAGGYVVYRRRKTQTLLRVRIEPDARRIIERYRQQTAASPYVFPILGTSVAEAAYSHYQSALSIYNRDLKRLAALAGLDETLTSYVSRHSWASAAYRADVPLGIISESLGHTSEKTTRIYIGSIDQQRLDEVNRTMLGRLKKFVST